MDVQSEWAERIRFADEFIPPLQFLLQELVTASPSKSIVFTSDYQGGPTVRKYSKPLTFNEF